MAARVLDDGGLAAWDGNPNARGRTAGEIAGRLWVEPKGPERRELNDALTFLRRLKLLHLEVDRMPDCEARWWLRTDDGGPSDASGGRVVPGSHR